MNNKYVQHILLHMLSSNESREYLCSQINHRVQKMKTELKNFLLLSNFLICTQVLLAQDSVTLQAKDLTPLIGNWKGNLTYLDYSSEKENTIPVQLVVYRLGESDDFVFSFSYPEEPKANSIDTVSVHYYGTMLDEEVVQIKTRPCPACLHLITEQFALDGNDQKPAFLRKRYQVDPSKLEIRKEVKFLDEEGWIKRNEYRFERQP
jgi:hypothetical protein